MRWTRSPRWQWTLAACLALAGAAPVSPGALPGEAEPPRRFPWREAGLTERQAAAHLLHRFAFGPRPGEIDRMVEMGLERWLEEQLQGAQPDPEVAKALRGLQTLDLPGREIVRRYPPPGLVLREAQRAGILPDREGEEMDEATRRQRFEAVRGFARERGYRPQRELIAELWAQKLLRAVYSENQLTEVLADFWFNHFNVSLTDNQARVYLLSYERDALRPHVLGRFRDLLGATARHPAMLLYLDNARSTAPEGAPTTLAREIEDRVQERGRRHRSLRGPRSGRFGPPDRMDRMGRRGRRPGPERPRGLNENYARELLELHTLGVDGGYTQQDVVEVARAFTGWTVIPPGPRGEEALARLQQVRRGGGLGFVVDGDFLFRADAHDAGPKEVLGHRLAPGRGMEDGEEVLDFLARHPATARHLARKLAVRFVSDEPPPALVDRLAQAYVESDGDVRHLLRTLASAPEFWAPEAVGQKIKTPFELAVSALRALDAKLDDPRETLGWIARMGQPLYAYQAPTGYPDRGEFWVNTGALLHRMNFGLELAAGRVAGVGLDLAALHRGYEPESREAALRTYVGLLLPERNGEEIVGLLAPMIQDPELARKVSEAAPEEASQDFLEEREETLIFGEGGMRRMQWNLGRQESPSPPTALQQVVGVILGSPEFQRR